MSSDNSNSTFTKTTTTECDSSLSSKSSVASSTTTVTRKTKIFKFNARIDVTDFIRFLIPNSDNPLTRVGENVGLEDKPERGLWLNVAACGKQIREHGQQKRPVIVCKSALFDRSMALVQAHTNSGCSNQLHGKNIRPGTLMKITKCNPIWQEADGFCEKKLTLLINDFSFEKTPKGEKGSGDWEEAIEVSGPFAHNWDEFNISGDSIVHVCDHGLVSHLKPTGCLPGVHKHPSDGVWVLDNSKIIHRQGEFIRDEEERKDYVSKLKKRIADYDVNDRKNSNRHCECVTRFGSLDCSSRIKPIDSVDEDVPFDDVCDRLNGNVVADSFAGLNCRKKRWSLHCYHFVNVLHGAAVAKAEGKKRVEPPDCLVGCIRLHHPAPDGNYVGFMPCASATI